MSAKQLQEVVESSNYTLIDDKKHNYAGYGDDYDADDHKGCL